MSNIVRVNNVSNPSDWQPVSAAAIELALGIYLPENRYVLRASRTRFSIEAHVRLDRYALTYPGILEYVTAAQLMTLVSQVGYVLIHESASAGLAPITSTQFLRIQRAGNVLFTRFSDLRFRRKVWHAVQDETLLVTCERFAVHRGSLMGEIKFDFAGSAARGSASVTLISLEGV